MRRRRGARDLQGFVIASEEGRFIEALLCLADLTEAYEGGEEGIIIPRLHRCAVDLTLQAEAIEGTGEDQALERLLIDDAHRHALEEVIDILEGAILLALTDDHLDR